MELQQRFEKLVLRFTSDKELMLSMWNELREQYTQKFRVYHNLNHLEELFQYYDLYQKELEHPLEVAFSIFYHDVIYSIWKKDNEEKSAVFARSRLQSIVVSESSIARIEAHILATKTHQASLPDTQWMVDFDLAILGQDSKVYDIYVKNIRKEYRRVPLVLYKPGRRKVLAHFLTKPTIYSTRKFQNTYEKMARLNLERELKSIKI